MMNLNELISGWSKNEFLAFLMLHIANADLELTQEEMMFIESLVDEKQFRNIQMVWSKCNDFECINIIRNLRGNFFPGDEGKESLLQEMTAFAKTDDKLNISEEIMILSLKKLL